jgi:phage antirepressor YoqD-like protein
MQLLQNKNTISSLELVEQINIFRKEEREKGSEDRIHANITHDSLLKVIREEFSEEIGVGELNETPYIHSQNGQTYPKFDLTLNQAKQVLVRESKIVRKAVIAYIEKLEQELSSNRKLTKKESLIIQLHSSDAIAVASAHKELVDLEKAPLIKLIEEQAPKVEFYNQVADTTSSFDMKEVSAMLKLSYGRNTLFRKLREANVLMDDNLPYRSHINNGYFIVVETKWMNPKTDQATATFQTRITQKGLDWLQRNQEKFRL